VQGFDCEALSVRSKFRVTCAKNYAKPLGAMRRSQTDNLLWKQELRGQILPGGGINCRESLSVRDAENPVFVELLAMAWRLLTVPAC
jgi:hypothetical protein